MIMLACFIEDKNVGLVMQRIAGLIKEPTWQPVVNAKEEAGKVTQVTNGDMVSMFQKYIGDKKYTAVNIAVARAFLSTIGQVPGRANYLIQKAQSRGLLKKRAGSAKRNTTYDVRKEK